MSGPVDFNLRTALFLLDDANARISALEAENATLRARLELAEKRARTTMDDDEVLGVKE